MTLRCETGAGVENVKIRIAEIDAPEKGQPFGNRSKEHLAALCSAKTATVKPEKRDRYGRVVARVSCGGVDASVAQVRSGMAWVFDRYATDRLLYGFQEHAQEARVGLWADANPMPPWEWRRRRSGVDQRRAPQEASDWVDIGDVGDTARHEQRAR